MENVIKKLNGDTESETEKFELNAFEMDLSEMEEVEPIESPACIIGKYIFVSS
jgi:hypothetical protein